MQRCLEEVVEIRYEFEYRCRHPDKRDTKNDVTEEVKLEFGGACPRLSPAQARAPTLYYAFKAIMQMSLSSLYRLSHECAGSLLATRGTNNKLTTSSSAVVSGSAARATTAPAAPR